MSSIPQNQLQNQLQALEQSNAAATLTDINRGIEKESLRITPDGKLAQTSHPKSLGSTLTHGSITTDYSEALMEFITPVSTSVQGSIQTLENIHSFVQQNLDEEMLWAASMPCIVAGDDSIPVANYGSSNVAQMKTVYRYGLGNRYGRLMQAISGIHYNFSMPQAYWKHTWEQAGKPGTLTDHISESYLALIRNFRRFSWLLIYLYGASPAVCASFLRGRDDHNLEPFDPEGKSLHLPYGTSLRMGGLGYNSDAQKDLNVCYNTLKNYVDTLTCAIKQPHPAYADIPYGQDGNYQQLNDSLLQIENEFYSPIRPKRVAASGEIPLGALTRAGIEYIEVRCIDVNPFTPVGFDAEQIRFLDTFLVYCLLEESPACDEAEQHRQAKNFAAVVNEGRKPGLLLDRGNTADEKITLTGWANQLLEAMQPIAALFDKEHQTEAYSSALEQQKNKVSDASLTPSARVLREMKEKELPFFRLAMHYSEQWAAHFQDRQLSDEAKTKYTEEAERSLAAQESIEQADSISFQDYLQNFYQQYDDL
ncbi:MAG: glutamate--cysteine ligase [Halioglobus sp.]